MTNDQKGGEGFPEMESLYEPQICDDLIYAKPMSNNQPAYDQNAQHDSLPGEGWEGVSETDDPYGPQICEEFPANPPMTDDQPTNNQKGWEGFSKTKSPCEPQICDDLMPAPPPMANGITTCGQIDALLTPELLAHILQTTPGNSAWAKAGNSLNQPNGKADEDDGGHKINN